MPLAYSNDLRWCTIWLDYYEKTIEKTEELLCVSTRSVRFLTLLEETGDVSPAIQQRGPP